LLWLAAALSPPQANGRYSNDNRNFFLFGSSERGSLDKAFDALQTEVDQLGLTEGLSYQQVGSSSSHDHVVVELMLITVPLVAAALLLKAATHEWQSCFAPCRGCHVVIFSKHLESVLCHVLLLLWLTWLWAVCDAYQNAILVVGQQGVEGHHAAPSCHGGVIHRPMHLLLYCILHGQMAVLSCRAVVNEHVFVG